MDNIKLHKFIKQYIKGNLSIQNEKELLSWIKLSEENKSLFFKEQKSINHIINQKDKNISLKWQSLKKRIEPAGKKIGLRTSFLKVASIAAAFIIGVLITTVVINNFHPEANQLAQMQSVTTPYGAKTNMMLPDGSWVWLNSGSTLSFPINFDINRPVTLEGEAYFEVEKSNKPFIVSTKYGNVEVLGTKFNVSAYEEEIFQATLASGSVKVKEIMTKKAVVIKPGQQAGISENKITVKEVEVDLFTSWKDGKLIFKKEYLPVVAKRLERWYNIKIELANDKRLSDIWYSGTIEMESFSEVLDLLRVTAPVDFTYNEKMRTIKIIYKQN